MTSGGAGAVALEVEKNRVGDLWVQRCAFCRSEVAIDAGDVTFGGEWYHAACWGVAREKLLPKER